MSSAQIRLTPLLLVAALAATLPAGSEVIEEIVAWVDGDIITLSELQAEEQALVQELYRRYTGEELDQQVQLERAALLMRMIDTKVLLHRAGRVFNLDKIGESYLQLFKEQQGLDSDEELARALEQQDLTREDVKKFLVARYAPQEIIRMEVDNRIAVGEKQVAAYYDSHQEEFRIPAQVTLREIVILAEEADKSARLAAALALHERATAGEDFGQLATEYSEAGTAENGGLLGPLKLGELSADLEKLAFSLPVGEVSELLHMPYGYHIVKVEERGDTRIKSLDEVRDGVRIGLENQMYVEELDEFLEKARSEATIEVNEKYQDRLPTGPGRSSS